MLFNSYEFIFLFLPVTLAGFFLIGGHNRHKMATIWIVAASLFFYGWWNPIYLVLILASIIFNYSLGLYICSLQGHARKLLLAAGVIANLGVLGYFKYANFIVNNVNTVFESSFELAPIVLPLAISFFTFQQITYLVDAYRGETEEYNFLHYCLFVVFFPQLIAGPIVHHKEMLPQFMKESSYRFNYTHFSIGLSIFAIGLFKKMVIADGVAIYATPVFSVADNGMALTFFEAWTGVLAYSFQLYFDFSGYSDMAIGLGRMFGIRLPLNFNSPYKATNIIDFWRRWHITLSRFLRDYLYIGLLGGNRKGRIRRHTNLLITMLLGGLWHGAGWGFVLWGFMHGMFLVINHAWRRVIPEAVLSHYAYILFGWMITFLAVTVAWVPFRAETLNGAITIWKSMAGFEGFGLPARMESVFSGYGHLVNTLGINFSGVANMIGYSMKDAGLMILMCSLIAFLLPNTQQFMRSYRPALRTYGEEMRAPILGWIRWRLNTVSAMYVSVIMYITYVYSNRVSEFLYFQF